jgi:hypothetical protein
MYLQQALLGVNNLNKDFLGMLSSAKAFSSTPFFYDNFDTAAWTIWKQRNAIFFYNVNSSLNSWYFPFKRELFLLSYIMKEDRRIAV